MNYIFNYPSTFFLYVIIIIFILILSHIAEKIKGKLKKICLTLIILILSLLSGFRGSMVGNDTLQYLLHIERWQFGISNTFPSEPGLYLISRISLFLINDRQFVLIVVALIINTLIVLRIWQLKKYLSFTMAIFLYIAIFYFISFSGIRQWLAIALVFYFSKYIFEMKYLKFSIVVLIASLFHNTALITLVFPLIDILASKLKYNKQKNTLISLFLFSPLLLLLLFLIFNILLNQYGNYINNFFNNFHLSGGTVIWLRLIFAVIIYLTFTKRDFSNGELYNRVFYLWFTGLIISIPGYYIDNIARLGFYFTLFEIILFAMIAKSKNMKKSPLFIISILFYAIGIFILELVGSGRKHIPYIPFWNELTF